MAEATILQHPFVAYMILPLLLVFVIVFAILQKSKILGDGKKQIDAIVAIVIALMVVGFAWATNIIVALMPILAIGLVLILIFMLLWSPFFGEKIEIPDWVKWTMGVIAAIVVIVAVIMVSGLGDTTYVNWFKENIYSVVFIIIIIVVVALFMRDSKDK